MTYTRTKFRKNHLNKKPAACPVVVVSKSNPLHVAIVRVNVVRPLCSLVFGKAHSAVHRMLAGALVMAIGVMIAKYLGHSPSLLVSHMGDGVGYALHGMGLIPFIESLASKFE